MAVDLALLHAPVRNRRGEIIASAVTNLDLHDIARTARTYGVRHYYVVTPDPEQRDLARTIVDHWRTGPGGRHNPDRREAFAILRLAADLDEVCGLARRENGGAASRLLATSAVKQDGEVGFAAVREWISQGRNLLLILGTASGLAPEVFVRCDGVLPPVGAGADYNHLPVRAAAAIVLDRLLGPGGDGTN